MVSGLMAESPVRRLSPPVDAVVQDRLAVMPLWGLDSRAVNDVVVAARVSGVTRHDGNIREGAMPF